MTRHSTTGALERFKKWQARRLKISTPNEMGWGIPLSQMTMTITTASGAKASRNQNWFIVNLQIWLMVTAQIWPEGWYGSLHGELQPRLPKRIQCPVLRIDRFPNLFIYAKPYTYRNLIPHVKYYMFILFSYAKDDEDSFSCSKLNVFVV